MNESITTYKIWAPDNCVWSAWAKPVLFAGPVYGDKMEIPEINWITELKGDTMIILDLPGKDGIEEGFALAHIGYRPVPLYNGVNGPNPEAMIVNTRDIVIALFEGAKILSSINLSPNAPPVFLLDSNRMTDKGKERGKYDNRWCVFPQDMPSADFLANQGIKKIIVRTNDNKIQNDLSHILCRYQNRGLKIYLCSGGDDIPDIPKETKVPNPSHFGSLIYRFKVMLGLSRNSTGGFGAKIPEQMQRRTRGVYYYRMG